MIDYYLDFKSGICTYYCGIIIKDTTTVSFINSYRIGNLHCTISSISRLALSGNSATPIALRA